MLEYRYSPSAAPSIPTYTSRKPSSTLRSLPPNSSPLLFLSPPSPRPPQHSNPCRLLLPNWSAPCLSFPHSLYPCSFPSTASPSRLRSPATPYSRILGAMYLIRSAGSSGCRRHIHSSRLHVANHTSHQPQASLPNTLLPAPPAPLPTPANNVASWLARRFNSP